MAVSAIFALKKKYTRKYLPTIYLIFSRDKNELTVAYAELSSKLST